MFAKRRVHGENAGGSYSFGPKLSPRRLRLESGTVPKPTASLQRSALVDALQRTLAVRRHADALELALDLIALEPDEPRWHQKHGDVLRLLDREPEAALAYRHAAERYTRKGLAAHAGALYRVADMLEGTVPTAQAVQLSDHKR